MERIPQIEFGDIELRTFHKSLHHLIFMMVMMVMTMAFFPPKRAFTIKRVVESTVIYQVDSLFKMHLTCCRRVELASPVI